MAGMPTKVAEYLATGVPTIITSVGEIAGVVHHGVDAYVCPPDDESRLSGMLMYVLTHPGEAADVGRRGRDLAVSKFDYRVVGADVAAFAAGIRTARKRRSEH
jgi:glycosyltransferase involved in cell wall biosynthesis